MGPTVSASEDCWGLPVSVVSNTATKRIESVASALNIQKMSSFSQRHINNQRRKQNKQKQLVKSYTSNFLVNSRLAPWLLQKEDSVKQVLKRYLGLLNSKNCPGLKDLISNSGYILTICLTNSNLLNFLFTRPVKCLYFVVISFVYVSQSSLPSYVGKIFSCRIHTFGFFTTSLQIMAPK